MLKAINERLNPKINTKLMRTKMNLWFLTEERPKKSVLTRLFCEFLNDYKFSGFVDALRILPVLENNKFTFTYEVIGFRCNKIEKVFIKTISGNSSFVDYLIFYQKDEPKLTDVPIYVVEETKTDDKESRNTGVYQRCSKFVFVNQYYPKAKKIMLYNLKVTQKKQPTETYIFGTKLLMTLGVKILGKQLDAKIFRPFTSIEEMIEEKAKMRKPPKGNVPILIEKTRNKIKVSGRLYKNGGLSHDPNIGALSIICAVLRKLGHSGTLEITKHGLEQKHLGKTNKFIQIANRLNIQLENLILPTAEYPKEYWHYETEGEKLGTIFIHLVTKNFARSNSIFENHAGSEKGYFITNKGEFIPLAKYKNREKYKEGDKSQIIHIPDLILIDIGRSKIINIEGKKYQYKEDGINDLKNYGYIEREYIKRHYPKFDIIRTVVLYGGDKKKVLEVEIGFLLNKKGDLILGIKAPQLFTDAINNLLDFWRNED